VVHLEGRIQDRNESKKLINSKKLAKKKRHEPVRAHIL